MDADMDPNGLKASFYELVLNYKNDVHTAEELWNEIKDNYSGEKRHYHNLFHLSNLYQQLSLVKEAVEDWEVILFSVCYHDIIYNPLKSDNEERSAKLAEKRLQSINFPASRIARCINEILATKGHQVAEDNDVNLFTDADLSVLGSSSDLYNIYTRQVRKEYSIYPDFAYKKGRRKVLEHFLNMDRIFKTNYFYDKFENQARKNMANELKGL